MFVSFFNIYCSDLGPFDTCESSQKNDVSKIEKRNQSDLATKVWWVRVLRIYVNFEVVFLIIIDILYLLESKGIDSFQDMTEK